jgi:hypothetical protein
MKYQFAVVAVFAVWVSCVGCQQRATVDHTKFFDTHDAKTHIEDFGKSQGLEAGGGGSGHSLGGPTGKKDFEVSLKGGASMRDKLMREYKEFVEQELISSGVSIDGRGESGDVAGFYFSYHATGVAGLIRVNSWIDSNGYIQVDAFLYEHK